MGRKRIEYEINNQIMGSIMNKMDRPLRDEIREIAKSKGISAHLLIEIYLKRSVAQHKATGV